MALLFDAKIFNDASEKSKCIALETRFCYYSKAN